MNPFSILFLLLIIVPIIEIYLLIQIGGLIGAWPTIFAVIFTAVVGAWLIRLQGFSTIARIRDTLNKGGLPAIEMLEGVVLLVAGAFLMTPGFFTDTVGFLCLIPALRRAAILRLIQNFFSPHGGAKNTQYQTNSTQSPNRPNIIEGEFKREDDK